MNADLKRVRDSSLDELPSPAKRRAMSVSTPPPEEGDEGGIEDWMKVVETRRKEAIYRQMLEYRRSYEQEVRKANELEAQKRVLEASVQAVEVCWQQLVSVVQNLAGQAVVVKEEEMLEPTLQGASLSRLEQALNSRLPATKSLLTSFADLAARNGLQATNQDLQAKCQKLQTEASSLRASTRSLENQIEILSKSNWDVSQDLQKARKALDRQKMEHDKAELAWRDSSDRPATPGAVKANGSGHATPNGKTEEDVKPAITTISTGLLPDNSELAQLAESRLAELEGLRAQHTALQQEVDRLRILSASPSEDILRSSPFFQIYLHKLAFHHSRADDLEQRYIATEKKLDELRGSNLEFRDAVVAEARAETEALRAQMIKKDSDLARLRGQRDEMNSELTERRAREAEKLAHVEEMEKLANARQERIVYLSSEVRRLKGTLGAQANSEGYLAFLRGDGGIDGDYVKALEATVQSSTDQITALTAQLREVASDPAAAASETQLRVELEEARRSLALFERIHGRDNQVSEDVKSLAERLEQNEKERSNVQMRLGEAEAATNALYTEVEGLSKLWEGLEKTVSSKVFELKDTETKTARLITEKAKADNKYFAAMRAKDGIDAEAKTAQRAVEKQLKLLEKAQEVERALNSQLATSEQGLTQLKNAARDLQTRLTTTTAEKSTLELQLQQTQKSFSEAQQILHSRVADAASEREARIKYQEEAESSSRMVKKLKERQEAVASQSDMSAGEWQMKEERDKLLKLLRCSCCEQNFKQQVITKCMHTFCKTCLDSRVASRQRKCPACGLAFAKEDIQTLYWQ